MSYDPSSKPSSTWRSSYIPLVTFHLFRPCRRYSTAYCSLTPVQVTITLSPITSACISLGFLQFANVICILSIHAPIGIGKSVSVFRFIHIKYIRSTRLPLLDIRKSACCQRLAPCMFVNLQPVKTVLSISALSTPFVKYLTVSMSLIPAYKDAPCVPTQHQSNEHSYTPFGSSMSR